MNAAIWASVHGTNGWLPAFIAQLEACYARLGKVLLIQQPMPSNAQAGGHFQLVWFDGPVEVDWNVGPLSLAARPRSRADISTKSFSDTLPMPRSNSSSLIDRRASVFSRSTEAHNQYKVSMSAIAARDALHVVELVEEVAAIHLLALSQALDLRGVENSSDTIRTAHTLIRKHVPTVDDDRAMEDDIHAVLGLIRSDELRRVLP